MPDERALDRQLWRHGMVDLVCGTGTPYRRWVSASHQTPHLEQPPRASFCVPLGRPDRLSAELHPGSPRGHPFLVNRMVGNVADTFRAGTAPKHRMLVVEQRLSPQRSPISYRWLSAGGHAALVERTGVRTAFESARGPGQSTTASVSIRTPTPLAPTIGSNCGQESLWFDDLNP